MGMSYEANHDISEELVDVHEGDIRETKVGSQSRFYDADGVEVLPAAEKEKLLSRKVGTNPKDTTPETSKPAHRTPRDELETAAAHLVLEKLNFKFLTDTANSNLGDWKTLYNLLVQEREDCKARIRSLTEFLGV